MATSAPSVSFLLDRPAAVETSLDAELTRMLSGAVKTGGTMLVAQTGGHLKQLHTLRPQLSDLPAHEHWVTNDKPQSRSLLADQPHDFVDAIASRDVKGVLKAFSEARRTLERVQPEVVVSTGAAIAIPYLTQAARMGIRSMYIESAARSQGPSLTGKVLARVKGVEKFSQYESWATGPWQYRGSVFDSYRAVPVGAPEIRKAVVTLGTLDFDFSRLARRLVEVLPDDTEVLWQYGGTDIAQLGISGHQSLPESELVKAMRDADVVISHAGCGSALSALEAGKVPVLVPRRSRFEEHVDDHQEQIAGVLAAKALSVTTEVEHLDLDCLLHAAGQRAERIGAFQAPAAARVAA